MHHFTNLGVTLFNRQEVFDEKANEFNTTYKCNSVLQIPNLIQKKCRNCNSAYSDAYIDSCS